mmetsp:Transcript_10847/g.31053  ORF Transcript_10847/g.31053 Transcript_10847/m.31053 type:complete len:212 (-) Transcript_10847:907-1542(-)
MCPCLVPYTTPAPGRGWKRATFASSSSDAMEVSVSMRAMSPRRQTAATGCWSLGLARPSPSSAFSELPREQPSRTNSPVGDSLTDVTNVPPWDAPQRPSKQVCRIISPQPRCQRGSSCAPCSPWTQSSESMSTCMAAEPGCACVVGTRDTWMRWATRGNWRASSGSTASSPLAEKVSGVQGERGGIVGLLKNSAQVSTDRQSEVTSRPASL